MATSQNTTQQRAQARSQTTPEGEPAASEQSGIVQKLERNQKLIGALASGLIVGVLLYLGYKQYILAPKIKQAQEEVFVAQQYFAKDSLQLALNGDGNYPGFLEIADRYSSTPTGELAHYYIGIIQLKQGQYKSAIERLNQFNTESYLISPMRLGALGNAHTELGEYAKAAEYFLKAANDHPNELTSPRFLFKAGLVLEADGQLEKALEVLEQLQREYKTSSYGQDAAAYIGRIEGKLSQPAS